MYIFYKMYIIRGMRPSCRERAREMAKESEISYGLSAVAASALTG